MTLSGTRSPRCTRLLASVRTLGLLLVVLAVAGCSPPPVESVDGDKLVLRILPFDVRGQDEGADYLGLTVAEAIKINLAQSEDLVLLDVSGDADTALIRNPAADRLVTGTLIREGGVVRAHLRLLKPADNTPLWDAEAFSATGDISDLIFRLTLQSTKAMQVTYPDLYTYLAHIRGTPPMSDSALMGSARASLVKGDNQGFMQASSQLVVDYPEEPVTHVFNAWALMNAWDAAPTDESYLERLRERMASLDQVDPASPYDEVIRGFIYRSSGKPELARSLYSRVLLRNDISTSMRSWILRQRSFTNQQTGNYSAALADAEDAVKYDPTNSLNYIALSKSLESVERFDDAIVASRQGLALQPDRWRLHQRLGLVYARVGNIEQAEKFLDSGCELSNRQEVCANLAVTLQRGNQEKEAAKAATVAESLPVSRWGSYNLACYRALLGDRDTAIENLQRSIDLGYADALIDTDPDFDSLRAVPAFKALVTAVHERIRSRGQLTTSVFPWQE